MVVATGDSEKEEWTKTADDMMPIVIITTNHFRMEVVLDSKNSLKISIVVFKFLSKEIWNVLKKVVNNFHFFVWRGVGGINNIAITLIFKLIQCEKGQMSVSFFPLHTFLAPSLANTAPGPTNTSCGFSDGHRGDPWVQEANYKLWPISLQCHIHSKHMHASG